MAYSLDGKRTLEWTTWKVTPQSATIGMPVWLNDDVSIMIPESGSPEDNLYSCDLRKGGQATRIPLSQSIAPEHVGVLPDNSILVSFYPGGPESELGYTDIRIKGNSAELTPGWLELPCLATVSSLVLSPNRQRIAWGLECDRKVAGSGWYRRLMRLIGMRDRTTWEMWTSDYRGKDWRQLGVVEDPRTSTEPYGVQWTPDGRCISFLVKTTLYTVPVD